MPEELAMAILLNKLESPEVQHHGKLLHLYKIEISNHTVSLVMFLSL